MPRGDDKKTHSGDFARILAGVFKRGRWAVQRHPSTGNTEPQLIVKSGGKSYLLVIKRSAEGRRDRLIPLLSQAVLEAIAGAKKRQEKIIPVGVVAAERIPPSAADHAIEFAKQYALGAGAGIIDRAGLRRFVGGGLEEFDAQPSRLVRSAGAAKKNLPDLFSGLNQWMLKILLGQFIPESLISVPRARFSSATRLAEAAQVSLMSASRFLRQLRNEGFVDEQEDTIRLVRTEELMERWAAAGQKGSRDIPVRWILRKEQAHLLAALRKHSESTKGRPRGALGLFAAADVLGYGFVQGVPPHIYLDRFDADLLREFGLTAEDAEGRADAHVRIPGSVEPVFRAAVIHDGVPVSDILQVWLDVSRYPARGREQADLIRRRVLNPIAGKS